MTLFVKVKQRLADEFPMRNVLVTLEIICIQGVCIQGFE